MVYVAKANTLKAKWLNDGAVGEVGCVLVRRWLSGE